MKRRRKIRLGSTSAEHEERAAYHRGSAEHAITRGLQALEDMNCSRAFSEFASAKLYIGEYEAHMASAGKASSHERISGKIMDIHRLEVDIGRMCLRPKSDFVVRKQKGKGQN
jgi:hypothetical protein